MLQKTDCTLHADLLIYHILRDPGTVATARPLLVGFKDVTKKDVVALCVLRMPAAER